MGPETFLGILPLNFQANDLSKVNVWLFPILKQHIVGACLRFFCETLLGMVEEMKQRSQRVKFLLLVYSSFLFSTPFLITPLLWQLGLEGKVFSSRSADALVYSVWSLLPSFCNYPLDTAKSFKDLLKPICSALDEEHDIRGIICSSLQILIKQNKRIREGKDNVDSTEICPAKQRAISHYTPEIAGENLNVLIASAPQLLKLLSGIFMKSTVDEGGSLQVLVLSY